MLNGITYFKLGSFAGGKADSNGPRDNNSYVTERPNQNPALSRVDDSDMSAKGSINVASSLVSGAFKADPPSHQQRFLEEEGEVRKHDSEEKNEDDNDDDDAEQSGLELPELDEESQEEDQ